MSVTHSLHQSPEKRARTRSAGKRTRAKLKHSPLEPNDVDQFKFRLVDRDGRHYFTDVRFTPPNGQAEDVAAVVDFFEGQCLNTLEAKTIGAFLAPLAIVPRLCALVEELQQVLCD